MMHTSCISSSSASDKCAAFGETSEDDLTESVAPKQLSEAALEIAEEFAERYKALTSTTDANNTYVRAFDPMKSQYYLRDHATGAYIYEKIVDGKITLEEPGRIYYYIGLYTSC